MSFQRWALFIFLLVQTIGTICSWLWQFVPSTVGVMLWGAALLVLVPGNFLAEWIVERALWRGGLSLLNMSVIATFLTLAINAIVWYAVAKVICLAMRHRRKPGSSTP